MKTLAEIAAKQPYPDYADWWPLGRRFTSLMQAAILRAWQPLRSGPADLAWLTSELDHYVTTVYGQTPREGLLEWFLSGEAGIDLQSGEFDALSFVLFRSAFIGLDHAGRHRFTQEVGRTFFDGLAAEADLDLPNALVSRDDFRRLKNSLSRVGEFLIREKYLRDHFAFDFEVRTTISGTSVDQSETGFLDRLTHNPPAFARYEMGYPAILPSAVYLFQMMGEAQHHSSRTIEELFARAGCQASETSDFDPGPFPADLVVEIWEIRRR